MTHENSRKQLSFHTFTKKMILFSDMRDGIEIITYFLGYEMEDSEFLTFKEEWLQFSLIPVEGAESDLVATFS